MDLFSGNLIQFDLSNFHIILGINWPHTYGAKIDCMDLKVTLTDEKGQKVYFMDKGWRNLVI